MGLYPIDLDLNGRRVLVVGLGRVGRRKAAGLVDAGAKVLGVDPKGWNEGEAAGVEVRVESYRAEHAQGMTLVFAAATVEVNRLVVADAKDRGIWVNSASEPGAGDFQTPAVWRDGLLTLAVSTSGASPALAAGLRDRAVEALGPSAAGLVALVAELRPMVLARLTDPARRRQLLADWASPRWLDLWTASGPEAVRLQLVRSLDEALKASDQDRPGTPAPDRNG